MDKNADELSQNDKALTSTIANPPSFFEKDIERHQKKY